MPTYEAFAANELNDLTTLIFDLLIFKSRDSATMTVAVNAHALYHVTGEYAVTDLLQLIKDHHRSHQPIPRPTASVG